jgi:hypothetical protein
VGLLPSILDIIFWDAKTSHEEAPADAEEAVAAPATKYLIIRQVQLCGIVKNIMQGQPRATIDASELRDFFAKFGQEFTLLLKNSATIDGNLSRSTFLEVGNFASD